MIRTGAPEEDIHAEEELIHHEMHVAAVDLDNSMVVAMCSFAFPARQITIFLFSRLCDRPWKYKFDDVFDMLLTSLVALWVERFYTYSHKKSGNTAIATTPEEIFMYNVI